MKPVGLIALSIIAGVIVGFVFGPGIGAAFLIGGLLATVASLVVLHPGRGRDIAAGGAVSDAASGWAEFHRELARSRRFERSFAIVRLAAGPGHAAEELLAVRDGVAGAARRTDRAWVDGDDVLVLLPETTPTTAARFTERVVGALTELTVTPTIARFPEDGITSGALIAVAYGGEAVPTPIGAVRAEPLVAPAEVVSGGG